MKRNSFPSDLNVQLLTPTSVVCDEPTTCVIVFSAAIPGNEDVYIKLSSQLKDNVFVLCKRVNSTVLTFQAPTNFPYGKAKLSLHSGFTKTLLSELNDVQLEFKSKFEYVNTLLENLIDPISFLSSAFGKIEKDLNVVDTKLASMFKKKFPNCLKTLKIAQLSKEKYSSDQIISMKYPTLMHFGARYNFVKLCTALLDCPGSFEALKMCNCDGLTPSSLAGHFGNSHLANILEVNDDVYETMSSFVDSGDNSGDCGEDETYMDMSSTYVGEMCDSMKALTDNINNSNFINGDFKNSPLNNKPGKLKKTLSADDHNVKQVLPKQMSLPNRPNLRHSFNTTSHLSGINEPSLKDTINDDYVSLLNDVEGNNKGAYDTVPVCHDIDKVNRVENEIYDIPPSINPLNNRRPPSNSISQQNEVYEVTQQQSVSATEDVRYTAGMNVIPPRCPTTPRTPALTPRCQATTFEFDKTNSISQLQSNVGTQNEIYDVPPIPNQYNQDVYDTIPVRDNIYDVPPPLVNNSVYDIPPSNCNDIYDVPSSLNNSIYDVPPSTNPTYDVPTSNANAQVYDVPPNINHQIYDTPPRSIHNMNTPPINRQATPYVDSKVNGTRPLSKPPFQPQPVHNGQYFNIPTSAGPNQSLNNSPFSSTNKTMNGNTQPIRIKSERHGKPMPTPAEMPSNGPPPPILPREKVVPVTKPKKPTPKPRK